MLQLVGYRLDQISLLLRCLLYLAYNRPYVARRFPSTYLSFCLRVSVLSTRLSTCLSAIGLTSARLGPVISVYLVHLL